MAGYRDIAEHRIDAAADTAENAAMAARHHVAARAGISLHDVARGEYALILNEHHARTVAALRIGPDLGIDVVDGIGDVLLAVAADGAVIALGGIAADRNRDDPSRG